MIVFKDGLEMQKLLTDLAITFDLETRVDPVTQQVLNKCLWTE
jgi:hypothetical protein